MEVWLHFVIFLRCSFYHLLPYRSYRLPAADGSSSSYQRELHGDAMEAISLAALFCVSFLASGRLWKIGSFCKLKISGFAIKNRQLFGEYIWWWFFVGLIQWMSCNMVTTQPCGSFDIYLGDFGGALSECLLYCLPFSDLVRWVCYQEKRVLWRWLFKISLNK